MEDTFYLDVPVTDLLEKSEGEDRKRCVRGYASTEDVDKDGETILQKGIDFSPLLADGYLNWDHQRRTINGAKFPIIIGVPTLAEIRDRGLWVEGELFNGDPMASEQMRLANEVWQTGLALQKSGRRSLAYSVEGHVTERRGKKIVKSIVRHVAVTEKPVNGAAKIEVLAKSFCCGRCSPEHPEYNPAHKCGNKTLDYRLDELGPALEKALGLEQGAILRENLDMGLTSVLYGDQDCAHFDRGTGRFENGMTGAFQHLTQCRGLSQEQAKEFLRRMVQAAQKSPWVEALVTRAGFVRS